MAVGTATDVPVISEHGVKINCLINDYLSKEKIVEITVTIFHPLESRLKSQTTNVRRGSTLFFSGEMTTVDGQLYIELHNFSFLKGQGNQVSSKANFMPWMEGGSTTPARTSNAQLIHNQRSPDSAAKYKPFQPNKMTKLADIATNLITINSDDNEHKEMGETVIEKRFYLICILYFLYFSNYKLMLRAKLFCDWRNVSPFKVKFRNLAQTSETCPNLRNLRNPKFQII